MFFLEFGIFFRQKVSSQAPLHTYLGPQRILGDMHFGARNALKFSALSNNPDFVAAEARLASSTPTEHRMFLNKTDASPPPPPR